MTFVFVFINSSWLFFILFCRIAAVTDHNANDPHQHTNYNITATSANAPANQTQMTSITLHSDIDQPRPDTVNSSFNKSVGNLFKRANTKINSLKTDLQLQSQWPEGDALCAIRQAFINGAQKLPYWKCNGAIALSDPCPSWSGEFNCNNYNGFQRIVRLFLSNGLTGSIPSQISALTSLNFIQIENNFFEGSSLPVQIFELTGLETLNIIRNNLGGTIPSLISCLTGLTQLWLNGNRLEGPIPMQLFKMTRLTSLTLSNNRLEGSIPSQISSLTGITDLYLNDNRLDGTIPSQISFLTGLTSLWLNDNRLEGSIPEQLFKMTWLDYIKLSNNRLEGSLTSQISKLEKLRFLYINNNRLSGGVGSYICKLNYYKYGDTRSLKIEKNNFICLDTCVKKMRNAAYDSDNFLFSDFCAQEFSLNDSAFTIYIIIGVSIVFAVSLIFSLYQTRFVFIFLVIFPFIDVLSDFLFIISSTFFTPFIFALCVFFYLLPCVYFLYDINYVEKISCRAPCIPFPVAGNICWLTSEGVIPYINGVRPSFVDEFVDSMGKIFKLVAIWIALLLLQLVTWIGFFIWTLFLDPLLIFWTLIGIFLSQTKLLCFVPVWNMWINKWARDSEKYKKDGLIDVKLLNKSLFVEMLLETLPELILQLANGILLRNFTIIGYISITVSAYFALNELYVFIYYVYYKKMSLENVPLTIEIPNKNRVTSLDSQHSTIRDELEMEKFTSIPVDVEKHQINVGGVAEGFISLRSTSDLKDSDIFSSLELRVHKIEKDTESNKSEIIRLTEENNELREESVALLSEIKQLYNENKTLAAVSASLQSEIGRISKESDELLKNSVVNREDISKLRSKVESLL